jgi:hypothetical protein
MGSGLTDRGRALGRARINFASADQAPTLWD